MLRKFDAESVAKISDVTFLPGKVRWCFEKHHNESRTGRKAKGKLTIFQKNFFFLLNSLFYFILPFNVICEVKIFFSFFCSLFSVFFFFTLVRFPKANEELEPFRREGTPPLRLCPLPQTLFSLPKSISNLTLGDFRPVFATGKSDDSIFKRVGFSHFQFTSPSESDN